MAEVNDSVREWLNEIVSSGLQRGIIPLDSALALRISDGENTLSVAAAVSRLGEDSDGADNVVIELQAEMEIERV